LRAGRAADGIPDEMRASVPIPFRDQDDLEEAGTAAYLRLEPDPDHAGYRGALFQVNARGEPVEFTYNRVETPNSYLWRPADVHRAALRRLTASLLAACPRVPRVLFALAAEAPSELFCQDLQVAIPVGRVAAALDTAGYSALEVVEDVPPAGGTGPLPPAPSPARGGGEDALVLAPPLHIFWYPAPPSAGTPERDLVQRMVAAGLLLEPFDRAARGLAEVYGPADPVRP
jgi:hypothetical protein